MIYLEAGAADEFHPVSSAKRLDWEIGGAGRVGDRAFISRSLGLKKLSYGVEIWPASAPAKSRRRDSAGGGGGGNGNHLWKLEPLSHRKRHRYP